MNPAATGAARLAGRSAPGLRSPRAWALLAPPALERARRPAAEPSSRPGPEPIGRRPRAISNGRFACEGACFTPAASARSGHADVAFYCSGVAEKARSTAAKSIKLERLRVDIGALPAN